MRILVNLINNLINRYFLNSNQEQQEKKENKSYFICDMCNLKANHIIDLLKISKENNIYHNEILTQIEFDDDLINIVRLEETILSIFDCDYKNEIISSEKILKIPQLQNNINFYNYDISNKNEFNFDKIYSSPLLKTSEFKIFENEQLKLKEKETNEIDCQSFLFNLNSNIFNFSNQLNRNISIYESKNKNSISNSNDKNFAFFKSFSGKRELKKRNKNKINELFLNDEDQTEKTEHLNDAYIMPSFQNFIINEEAETKVNSLIPSIANVNLANIISNKNSSPDELKNKKCLKQNFPKQNKIRKFYSKKNQNYKEFMKLEDNLTLQNELSDEEEQKEKENSIHSSFMQTSNENSNKNENNKCDDSYTTRKNQ